MQLTSSVAAALLLIASLPFSAPAQAVSDPQQTQQWQEDLRYLADELPKRHPNLFFHMPRADFDREVANIHAAIPMLRHHEVTAALARLVAMVGDGHTLVWPLPFRTAPLVFRWFPDGVYIVAAPANRPDLLGARLHSVGGEPIDVARQRIETMISADNEWWRLSLFPSMLAMPQLLHALRLSDDPGRATYTVIHPGGQAETFEASPGGTTVAAATGVDGYVPPWGRNMAQNYWFEHWPETKTIYVAYNVCLNSAPAFADFAAQVLSTWDRNEVRQLIIDVRNNNGGDSSVVQPLLDGIRSRRSRRPETLLFGITGRATASSGMWVALELKDELGATIIGEPTGGKPNAYGELRSFLLPNSRLEVRHSTRFWRKRPNESPALFPDVTAIARATDYFARHDPALAAILAWPSSGQQIREATDTVVVTDAATFRPTEIAPGMLISLFGNLGLSDSRLVASMPLPDELDGVRVLFGNEPAALMFVSPTQINAVAPGNLDVGSVVSVRVVQANTEIASATSEVLSAVPRIFRRDTLDLQQPGAVLPPNGAAAGDVIEVYGTGVGVTADTVPKVFIGRHAAEVLYSGVSDHLPGVWQINVRIPAGLETQGRYPLVLSQDGALSNPVTVDVQ